VKEIHIVYSKSNGPSVLMGMYIGSGFEDCAAGGHMSWLKKCFEDNYI
jgi:hypothetical protein